MTSAAIWDRKKREIVGDRPVNYPSFLSLYAIRKTGVPFHPFTIRGFEEKFLPFLPQGSSVGVDNTGRKSERLERMRKDPV